MKKLSLFVFLICVLTGCFDKTFDFRNHQSLENMMSGMSLEEQRVFLDDIQLAADALGGDHNLNGYTVEEVKAEAENARAFLNKKNVELLKEIISEMESIGKESIRLHMSSHGLFSMPKEGYIAKTYSINKLKEKLLELSPTEKSQKENNISSEKKITDNISIENQLADSISFKSNTKEREKTSSDIIKIFKDSNVISQSPNGRVDYTDYYIIGSPAKLMGHDILLIEEEYMDENIGCCVNPGFGFSVKINGNISNLVSFAENNGCSFEEALTLSEKLKSLDINYNLPQGDFVYLSCRENDIQ
ncbi:hypothetical protein [Thiothrix unzii]|uniref:Lipoprotein n=1 Tax=Thiothrix unzii TaxID=111769 RepID=A0A975FBD9_9GAMM|nr:hypothetical protein [Thiothrix unzii]QTR54444.1 hypothetical protein J9260_04940 [Thiothrix unzii]